MPQDAKKHVPVEASETLAFTPSQFLALHEAGKIEDADLPVFTLRACTERDKRFRETLLIEIGAQRHTTAEVRAEILRGLEALWSPDAFESHKGILEAYWSAREDFDLQAKDDPSLVWSYDPVIERAIKELDRDLAIEWRPYGKIRARNLYATEMALYSIVAVTVRTFTGLPIEPEIDRRYLDIDSIAKIDKALGDLEEKHGLERGNAWTELWTTCTTRMFLDEEEAKNSASPSLSETPQPNSKTGDNQSGSSLASAPSEKTQSSESDRSTGNC